MENIFFTDYTGTFDGSIPFSRIEVDMYEPAIERGIEKALEEVNGIATNPEPPTFANTIEALDRAGADLERVMNAFGPLVSALSSDRMMEIQLRVSPRLSEFGLAVAMNEQLWERVKTVYENRCRENLDQEQLTMLEDRYHSFRLGGALLTGDAKDEFKKNTSEQSELVARFGNNVLNEINATKVEIAESESGGIDNDLIEIARKEAEKAACGEGMLRFGLDQPTYMAVMKSAQSRDVRRKFYLAYCGRNMKGDYNNLPVLARIAEIRRRNAVILGYENAAQLRVERNMAHTPGNVMKLLDDLREAYSAPLGKELAEVADFAGHDLEPWDYQYYSNKLRQAKYSFDEEALRPYLSLDNVVKATFSLANRLYGITFTERDDVEKYHPDVRVFSVNDADGSYIGLLYMDFFTRESKRPGAWMTEFRPQHHEADGTDVRPHITIVTNFAPPSGGKPALLRPRDVETLLHEFGHALHGLLSRCRYVATAGTNVRRDFVELPSQMNEGFATCDVFLSEAGRHYSDGSSIPSDLVESWRRSLTFGAAYQCIRQLNFGYLDMAWHMLPDAAASAQAAADPVEFERKSTEIVRIFEDPDGTAVSPQFSHIFAGGYAAGYYSYKWAEVLAADAFEAMQTDGVINPEASASFRRNILERGGSEDPAVLYRRFRGRDAHVSALLRRDELQS